jgi:thioredoxin 1
MPDKNQKKDDKVVGAVHLTDATFKDAVAKATEDKMPIFIDFFAEWCGPCKMAAPVVDKLAGEYEGKVLIAKVDVDKNTVARDYGVMSIPTVVILKDGEEIDRKTGFPGEAGYKEMIEKSLK